MQYGVVRRREFGYQPYPDGREQQYQAQVSEHIIDRQDHALLPGQCIKRLKRGAVRKTLTGQFLDISAGIRLKFDQ
jgi:hypothetical protein